MGDFKERCVESDGSRADAIVLTLDDTLEVILPGRPSLVVFGDGAVSQNYAMVHEPNAPTREGRNLRIYYLKRDTNQPPFYDVTDSLVIAAESAAQARTIAQERPGDEGTAPWEYATVIEVGEATQSISEVGPHVICRDEHSG